MNYLHAGIGRLVSNMTISVERLAGHPLGLRSPDSEETQMASNRTVSNIRDVISDVMSDRNPTPKGEIMELGRGGFPSVTSRHGKGEMIRDLARAVGDASERSSKGGKCGGGMGGQKAGGIKGGGKRKTHFGRKRGTGGR